MVATKKRSFFRKKLIAEARRRGKYADFKRRVDELMCSDTSGLSESTRRYGSSMQAGREILSENFISKIEGQWKRHRARYRQVSAASKNWNMARRMTLGYEALIAAITRERARDRQLREAEKAARELEKLETREIKAKARLAERRIKRIEARAEASQARTELYRRKKELMEQEQKRQEEIAMETAHARQQCNFDTDVKDESVDILSATEWVLKNLPQLVLVSDNGVRKLNPQLMADAPSNTARAVAMYAMEDHMQFMNKFAIRLFPKEVVTTKDVDAESKAQQEKLDPAFGELERYFDTE